MTTKKVMRKRWATTPVLRAGTYSAYDVLQHVYTLVKEEPKRLNMQNWVDMLRGKKLGEVKVNAIPACGTVACLAGWVNVSTKNPKLMGSSSALAQLFGVSSFNSLEKVIALNTLFWTTHLRKSQVLTRLKAYMAQYETQLRAYQVVVPKTERA